MDKAQAFKRQLTLVYTGLGHDFQTGSICKTQKIGGEACFWIVVEAVGLGLKVGFEEGSRPFQVPDIEGDVLDVHPFLLLACLFVINIV